MATWAYADWITYDGADRLTRLRLHIAEVSQRTMGTSARGNSVTTVDPQYLQGLLKEESKLTERQNVNSYARNRAQFSRD